MLVAGKYWSLHRVTLASVQFLVGFTCSAVEKIITPVLFSCLMN